MANLSTTHIVPGQPLNILSATGKSSAGSENGSDGTTAVEGAWYRMDPRLGRLWFTSKLITGADQGATADTTFTATITIEGSNDGSNAASTVLHTFSAQQSTTDTVVLGGPIATSLQGAYGYIRANLTSLTTGTAETTGLAYGCQVDITVNAGFLGQN